MNVKLTSLMLLIVQLNISQTLGFKGQTQFISWLQQVTEPRLYVLSLNLVLF